MLKETSKELNYNLENRDKVKMNPHQNFVQPNPQPQQHPQYGWILQHPQHGWLRWDQNSNQWVPLHQTQQPQQPRTTPMPGWGNNQQMMPQRQMPNAGWMNNSWGNNNAWNSNQQNNGWGGNNQNNPTSWNSNQQNNGWGGNNQNNPTSWNTGQQNNAWSNSSNTGHGFEFNKPSNNAPNIMEQLSPNTVDTFYSTTDSSNGGQNMDIIKEVKKLLDSLNKSNIVAHKVTKNWNGELGEEIKSTIPDVYQSFSGYSNPVLEVVKYICYEYISRFDPKPSGEWPWLYQKQMADYIPPKDEVREYNKALKEYQKDYQEAVKFLVDSPYKSDDVKSRLEASAKRNMQSALNPGMSVTDTKPEEPETWEYKPELPQPAMVKTETPVEEPTPEVKIQVIESERFPILEPHLSGVPYSGIASFPENTEENPEVNEALTEFFNDETELSELEPSSASQNKASTLAALETNTPTLRLLEDKHTFKYINNTDAELFKEIMSVETMDAFVNLLKDLKEHPIAVQFDKLVAELINERLSMKIGMKLTLTYLREDYVRLKKSLKEKIELTKSKALETATAAVLKSIIEDITHGLTIEDDKTILHINKRVVLSIPYYYCELGIGDSPLNKVTESVIDKNHYLHTHLHMLLSNEAIDVPVKLATNDCIIDTLQQGNKIKLLPRLF